MNQSQSSFGTYEAFRIIVPGYYFATLLMCLVWAVANALGHSIDAGELRLLLVFIAVGLISGLTLYAKESTKRRKAFQENQPSLYLKTKARAMSDLPVLEETDALQLYFFILNNYIPIVFHEKIFFFGTIYHIMIQIRRTSLWFAVLATLTTGALAASGIGVSALGPLSLLAGIIWLIYLLNVRFNKADRKMQENYQDQIFWLQMHDDLIVDLLRKRNAIERG